MSVTINIAEEKLREVEEALQIDDPSELFLALVEEKLARFAAGSEAPGPPPVANSESRGWTADDFEATLVAAGGLPMLADEEFDALEHEVNRPLAPAWSE